MSVFQVIEHDHNRIVLYDNVDRIYCNIRVLEPHIININMNEQKEINFPTWTVTPGDTPLPFEGISRQDMSPFSCPNYTFTETEDTLEICTSQIKLVIQKEDFYLSWFQKDKTEEYVEVLADRRTQSYKHHISPNHPTCHYLQRYENEMYFGLGEKTGVANRHGKRFRMKNIDAMGYNAETTDPLYKHIPFYITYKPDIDQAIGIFYDDYQDSVFDFGQELDNYHGYYRYYETKSSFLDYYVIAGPKVKDVTQRFSWLTGRPTMMPQWSLSYSGSTMQYTDEPNSHERMKHFLSQCQTNQIAVRSFHLSSGYTSIEDKRYVFNWNYDKFPDPKAFGKSFTDQGVEIVANIKPSLMLNHPLLHEVLAFDGFVKDEHGEPLLIQFWDDKGYYLDFTNPNTITWWQDKIKTTLLDNHINCTWNDNNEFEIWDDQAQVYGFGQGGNFNQYKAIMPLLMMKASREIQMNYHQDNMPYVISRSGCAGMGKYVQTWTGDNHTSWHTLKFNNKMAIGLSLSGVFNFGHDIGGFSGPKPAPELFLRWVQCGVFYPRFSIHSWNSDGSVNEAWMHPEVIEEVKNAMHFHERLTPYLQELVEYSHYHFEPIIRPTFYDFYNDQNTYLDTDDFMLGNKILVCPIVEQGQTERNVYLPENKEGWVNYHTNESYKGGQTIPVPTTLEHIPLFIRKSSSIPMYNHELTEVKSYYFE
ncbi:TIM-barrel domain-containing protein [Priestia endophytica]|uniref:Alpha-glucosidase n=1 Tax=Priestia endophytica TaxID=135735 RepID=A0AAX1QB96_9BACI|nr:TIM-barrel domain-containing protein [Priestia endophytica]RAS78694.1 alpha-glucosidase [Priestia endophytica]RAS85443.1 alpha-glucosidase [Priestia endophytica]